MDPDMHTRYVTFFSASFADELGMGNEVELPEFQAVMSNDDRATPLPD
ncbi:hypothetical protein [Streptomyces sp. NPDC008139]